MFPGPEQKFWKTFANAWWRVGLNLTVEQYISARSYQGSDQNGGC